MTMHAHRWKHSYFLRRTQAVKVDNITSRSANVCFCVPFGSLLGPQVFTIYCYVFKYVFEFHQPRYHTYVEDFQLYVEFPREQPAYYRTVIGRISHSTADVKDVMDGDPLPCSERE